MRRKLAALIVMSSLAAAAATRAAPAAGARDAGAGANRDAGAGANPDAGAEADAAVQSAAVADAGAGTDAGADAPAGGGGGAPAAEDAAEGAQAAEEGARLEEARAAAEEEARAAELARKQALARAEEARSAAERAVARERGKLEGVRAEQAAYRGELARRRQEQDRAARARGARSAELLRRAREVTAGSAEADAVYDVIVGELQGLRRELSAAIAEVQEAPAVPRYEGAPAELDALAGEGQQAELAGLGALASSLEKAAAGLGAEARELAWQDLSDVADRESEMNAARIALLERVSPGKRGAVLGFGREGIEQLRREVLHVRLALKYRATAGDRLLRGALGKLRDPFVLGGALTKVLLLGAMAAGAGFAARRRRAPLEQLRATFGRLLRQPALLRPAQAVVAGVDALFGELCFLAVMLLVPAIVDVRGARSGWAALYEVLLWYAGYRLALSAVHRFLAWTALGDAEGEAGPRSAKLLRSVRLCGRYALAVALVLSGSSALLGEGYLYHLVARFAWLGSIPIAWALVRWWRADIADAYLRRRASGALAGAVRRTRGRWYGFFVAVAAFAALTAGFAALTARRFVLGFEQSRKALAYLFRRRLERRAEDGGAAAKAAPLPEDLLACLSAAPVDGEAFAIDRFPGMDQLDEALAAWREGGRIGAALVVGRTGFGKTSWLRAAERRAEGLPITRVALTERAVSGAEVLAALGRGLGAPEEAAGSAGALSDWLRAGERRVVVIDDMQLWFLRRVGALGGWEAFLEVVERAGDQVFWLGSFAQQPYELLRWARGGDDVFRAVIRLPAWTEPEIAALLEARTRAAGRQVRYDDLFLDHLEGVEAEAQLLSTAQDYNRLIWDYAEGSPRVAIDCWRRSLSVDEDGALRVRLFESPEPDALEALGEVGRFALAAVVWHERIRADEAAAALGLAPLSCEDALRKLFELGALRRAEGGFRVTTAWWPAVVRYLRRKHLIEA